MKFVIAALVAFSLCGTANSGTLVFEAEEEEEIIIVEEEPMGSSNPAQPAAFNAKAELMVANTESQRKTKR